MIIVSMAIAASGLFVRYGRSKNAVLMTGAALLMAFIWFLNRIGA